MSELIAAPYPDEKRAEQVFDTLQAEGMSDRANMVYVTKDKKGRSKLHQAIHTAGAVASGMLSGFLFGFLDLGPLSGMALGARLGAKAATLQDYGVDRAFLNALDQRMQPGCSAVFMLAAPDAADRIQAKIVRQGGTVLRTSLSPEAERKLQTDIQARAPGLPAPAKQPEPAGT
jgi:uncharacterized membrane protein